MTYDTIKKVLQNYSIEQLALDYNKRQHKNQYNNDQITGNILDKANIKIHIETTTNFAKLRSLMITIFNSQNKDAINWLNNFLNKYNYNCEGELIEAIQTIDSFESERIIYELFNIALKGFLIVDSFKEIPKLGYVINSRYGKINLGYATDILNIEPIPYEKRSNRCHDITAQALYKFPNLYGAYYYIPQTFSGYLEHSVLLDLNQQVVYDLTSNCALDYATWKKFFPNCSFIISGQKFISLNEQIKDDFNEEINLAHIEEIKRIRKK